MGGVLLDGGVLFLLGVPALAVCAWLAVRRGLPVGYALLWVGVGVYLIAAGDRLFFPLAVDPGVREIATADLGDQSRVSLMPLATVRELIGRPSSYQAVRQIGGNIGLLLPLGGVLPILVPHLRRFGALLLAASAFTLAIESVQYLGSGAGFMRRAFDVDDLMLNVFGAVLGYAAWWLVSGLRSRT